MGLFKKYGEFRKYLEEKKENIKRDIKDYTLEIFNNYKKETLKKFLLDKYIVNNIPTIDIEKIEMTKEIIEEKEPFYDNMFPNRVDNGTLITVTKIKINCKVIFDGDVNYFYYKPSTYNSSCSYKEISINDNTLCFDLKIRQNELEQKNKELRNEYINKLARAPFNDILFMLNSLKKQAEAFNNSLPEYIENLLDNRINEIKKTNELLDSINIPLKLNKNAPNIEPIKLIPITKNNLQLNDLPKDKIGAISKEYSISNDDYNNIINIIHLVSIMMENTAFTFGSLEEESIRDVLLVSLNSHYERMVTGETFRKRGKTDILIQFENNIAYIGECKIWNGKAQIKKAINQLTSYCSWKDSKTSLIYYSKNKDFKNLINTINEYLDNNENKDIISSKKIKDNMWACKIKKNKNEILDMNLCIYDLYSKKNIKGNN